MRTLALGRLFGLAMMMAGIGTCSWFGFDAAKRNAEFYQWLDDVPMSAEIDLSVPGTTAVTFNQTCQCSHGEYVYLDPTNLALTPDNFRDKMDELSGRIEIIDANDELIESSEFNESTLMNWGDDYILTRIPLFKIGKYNANIYVDSPASKLIGPPQQLTAKYHLCGLELMPAYLSGAIAILASMVTLVSGIFTVPWLRRFGIWSLSGTDCAKRLHH